MDAAASAGQGHNIETAIAILRQRFADRVQTGEAIRRQHGHTLTWLENQPPDVVVWPNSTEEVGEIVRIAATHNVPIIPFGAGTSLEGHVNAPRGGISLDFANMSEVLAVNHEDLDCVVQPGISRKAVNDYLRDTGLILSNRPRRRRSHPWWYGGDPRLGHQRRALRNDARERAQHYRGNG